MRRVTAGLENLVQVLCCRRKALFVVRLSPKSGDSHVVHGGARRKGVHKDRGEKQYPPWRPIHTTPHFRRSSHSVIGSPSNTTKTMGIFHNSFVVRTEIPASEYAISR